MKSIVEAVARVQRRPNRKWKLTVVSAGNHEKLLWSEHYDRKVDAVYACRWLHPTLVAIELEEGEGRKRSLRRVTRAELGLP